MSAPIRSDDGIDDALRYAPRWARQSPSIAPELRTFAEAPPIAPAAAQSPPMAPGLGGPNIELPLPPLRPFEGDVAVKDLRRRLSLDPDLALQPPARDRRQSVLPWIGRFSLVLILAAVVGFTVTMLMLPRQAPQQPRVAAAATPAIDGTSRLTQLPVRLVVESQWAFANDPLPLGISLSGASGEETVTLAGLVAGTRLSAGAPLGPTGWRLTAQDLATAFAHAPKDFVGAMDAAIDLRSARDRIVDSQTVRLEWFSRKEAGPTPQTSEPKPAIRPLDPEEITTLMKRGQEFLGNGDITAARLVLRRAASAGNAQAALVLGATFDPFFLSELGVLGLAPDPAQARTWYERAVELGSTEASRRLERIAKAGASP